MNNKENISENEMFYKTICEKYVGTMNKEMLLEINNEILYIFIEDKYIDLKDAGKINIDNYKNYLEEEYSEFHYKSYSDLFFQVIKDNIRYDLNDLGVFDLDDKWGFYLTFDEIRKIGFGDIVKENYPLIQKYGVSKENIIDFFNQFSLEQLDMFEETLRFYFIEGSIIYDEIQLTYSPTSQFESKEDYSFNSDILRLACGLISYGDFIKNYTVEEPSKETLIEQEVIKYFYENKIENLKEYGSDRDEGLYKLSSLYSELMDKLNIKYNNIFTVDGVSGGKYITTISFDNESGIVIDTKSRDGIEYVRDNLISISEEYKKCMQKENEKTISEIDYEIN